MFLSIAFAAVGVAGALYSLVVAVLGLQNGPLCKVILVWSTPFKNRWHTRESFPDGTIQASQVPIIHKTVLLQWLPDWQQLLVGKMHRAEGHCAVQHWTVWHSAGHKLSAADSLCHSDDQRALRLSVWNLHWKRGKMNLKSEMKTL